MRTLNAKEVEQWLDEHWDPAKDKPENHVQRHVLRGGPDSKSDHNSHRS